MISPPNWYVWLSWNSLSRLPTYSRIYSNRKCCLHRLVLQEGKAVLLVAKGCVFACKAGEAPAIPTVVSKRKPASLLQRLTLLVIFMDTPFVTYHIALHITDGNCRSWKIQIYFAYQSRRVYRTTAKGVIGFSAVWRDTSIYTPLYLLRNHCSWSRSDRPSLPATMWRLSWRAPCVTLPTTYWAWTSIVAPVCLTPRELTHYNPDSNLDPDVGPMAEGFAQLILQQILSNSRNSSGITVLSPLLWDAVKVMTKGDKLYGSIHTMEIPWKL